MRDPAEFSRLFEVSSRVRSAATALRQVADNETLTPDDKSNLFWAGEFLHRLNWFTPTQSGIAPDITVEATEIGPFFYTALMNCFSELHDAGVDGEEGIVEFLRNTVELLRSGGSQVNDRKYIPLAARFFEELARLFLIRIDESAMPLDYSTSILSPA